MIHLNRRQRGFTLAELMVAVAIGLVMLASMASLFLNNSRAQSEIEKANRQIENGRYAVQLLTEDLRLAGFFAEFNPTVLTMPAALPDPCSVTLADIQGAIRLHVQAYDDIAADDVPDCLTDVKPGTDIIVVRHASNCITGEGACDATSAGGPYFQASRCNAATELTSATLTNRFRLEISTSLLDRRKRDCTTTADIRRYQQHIYFIANNNNSGDGIPTLKRAELTSTGSTISHPIAPMVEGVEDLQLLYGVDTNNNGTADAFQANPVADCTADACRMTNFSNIVSVRMHVLARNLEKTAGYSTSKTYELGYSADNTAKTVTAGSDGYKRHVFQSLISLTNPAGRRM
jgi:type IV pilus assembly protein PilW